MIGEEKYNHNNHQKKTDWEIQTPEDTYRHQEKWLVRKTLNYMDLRKIYTLIKSIE